MIKYGALEGVDEIYGYHNKPLPNCNVDFHISDSEMMSHSTTFKIRVIGKGGHGSTPEKCNNPLPIASRVYLKIFQEFNELREKNSKITFSIATFNGGTAANVIPNDCLLTGTTRTFSNDDTTHMRNRIKQITEDITSEENASCEIEFLSATEGPVINHPECAQRLRKVAIELYGADKVSDKHTPSFGSEDFADYLSKVKGAFFWRTTRNLPIGISIHTRKYDFDDSIIPDVTNFWCNFVLSRFNLQ